MRAATFDRFGPPGVLHITELPDPEPGPGQVRVRVHAAGVQPFDVKFRTGRMTRIPATFPQRIGQEYAGIIDQVGAGVIGLEAGTAVLGSSMLDACADYVIADAATVVPKPAELGFPVAAGLVAAAQTASGALHELGVGSGDVLLMHAGAGSVGTVATQLARLAGATVIATASPENHGYLRGLGAIPVTYGDGLVDAVRALGERVTVAIDAVGGQAIKQSVELGVAPERVGTIVGDPSAQQYGATMVRVGRSPARLAGVIALAARGEVVMPVRVYPFAQVVAAHTVVESGHGRGKVVLSLE
ncbi:NADP-dependent oxidoreductase [Winogradskya consettensis]|uniref:Oxidoreductase n=1 Tax=Winogradskya consettensis TaxID=113560 RepID=A0A919SW69_9ACTN|nr:NADP-dependent oxidoreductase [Actinoplanes consettensis]GIM79460.1 oxidoreductase [Actinoplanes consettensis]